MHALSHVLPTMQETAMANLDRPLSPTMPQNEMGSNLPVSLRDS